MKKLFILSLGLISATAVANADNYSITAHLTEQMNGKTAYLVDFDTRETVDSTVVDNATAIFNGEISTPVLAHIVVNRRPLGALIVESGNIEFDKGIAKGGTLNDKMTDLKMKLMQISNEFRALPDSIKNAKRSEINHLIDQMNQEVMLQNIDNAVGFAIIMQNINSIESAGMNALLAKNPNLINYKRIAEKKAVLDRRSETEVGQKFKDFAVEYDGKTYRLSDYVGKGKYVLVDFWASWCGPCIAQTKVIKEILKEYGPKGLEVLGIAVWDKPEDTLEGIKSHDLPWTNIINAQSIPTEIYGIQGIPCIILFAPDGTILSRNKQGDELKADVAKAFSNAE